MIKLLGVRVTNAPGAANVVYRAGLGLNKPRPSSSISSTSSPVLIKAEAVVSVLKGQVNVYVPHRQPLREWRP